MLYYFNGQTVMYPIYWSALYATARGNIRGNIFLDKGDFNDFLTILCKVNNHYHLVMHCYCMTHNHYQLLLETPEGNLSRGIRQLNGIYAQYFNKKHQKVGQLIEQKDK